MVGLGLVVRGAGERRHAWWDGMRPACWPYVNAAAWVVAPPKAGAGEGRAAELPGMPELPAKKLSFMAII